jgi:hypothetical protein
MNRALLQMQRKIEYHLEEIKKLFKPECDTKITIVIRNPGIEGDADVVMTRDDWDKAVEAIIRAKAKEGVRPETKK